jgi:hypothetical protein
VINEEVRPLIEPELADDEELIWADKPAKRPYPWRGVSRAGFWCIWMLFVTTFVCIFVFGDSSNMRGNPSLVMRLIFASVGIAMFTVGYAMRRTYLKAFLGPKYEVYGLTNKRAIILSPLWQAHKFMNWRGHSHSKNFIDSSDLDVIKVELSPDQETGTIIFSGWWDKIRFKWYVYPNPDSPKILSNLNGFRNIPNPQIVTDLIVEKFGAKTNLMKPHENKDLQIDSAIKAIRHKRVALWSAFPIIWLLFSAAVGASSWLFISFFTFPFFIASLVYAVREIIRPDHSYRISS